jgi:hypothetical protein
VTTSDAELDQMLAEAYRHGNGPARFAALDTVFRHADAAGRTEFAYRARMRAFDQMHYAGEYARAFMTFSWLLATFDRHPEVAGASDEHTLLWRFKWIIWQLSQFSGISLEKSLALLDDMERRYRAGNHSLHAVHQHRAVVALHLGDLDAAGQAFEQMATARRDGLSDCRACVPTSQVAYLVARGDFEEAVRVGAPFTGGGCTEQPHQILSYLLLPYLRTGRTAEAIEGHKKAYARIRDSRHHLELIALNVQFCGLTGNQAYGLGIVERHLPWLDRPASPSAAMEFAAASALVLRRVIEDGAGETPVRRATDNGDRRWLSTVTETYAELAALARSMAADFDRRNGNAYQSSQVEATMAAEPLVASLPLTVFAGRPIGEHAGKRAVDDLIGQVADRTAAGDETGAARRRLDVAYALRNAAQWGDALETAEEARRSLDRAGLTAEGFQARYLLLELYRRIPQPLAARQALTEELLTAPQLPETLPPRAILLEETAHPADGQRAADRLLEAAALHRAAGDEPAEARTLVMALRFCREVPADLAGIASRVDAIVTGQAVADAQDHLCRLEIMAGRPEQALVRAERHAAASAELALRAANLMLDAGRYAEAEQLARPLAEAGDEDVDVTWPAAIVVARSLRARHQDASEVMAEHGIDEDDLADQ